MVLYCDELKVSRSLRKNVRNKGYEVRVDTAFAEVLEGCAAPRATGHLARAATCRRPTCALHRAGHAHSFETWREGELVGGLYGVAIGRMFYGESMFSRATDASKVALVRLVAELRGAGLSADRLPDAHRRSSPRSAPAKSPGATFLREIDGAGKLRRARWKVDLRRRNVERVET